MESYRRLLAVTILLSLLSQCTSMEFSDIFHVCKANDPDLNDCARDSLQHFLQVISKEEMSEFKLPHLDPLRISELSVGQGNSQIGFVLKLTNAEQWGFDKIDVISARVWPKSYRMEFDLFVPEYHHKSQYEIERTFLFLPVFGSGPVNATVYNSNMKWILQGSPKHVNNETYIHLNKFQIKWKAGSLRFHFGNLYNGERFLGFLTEESTNKFLNDNNRAVLDLALPSGAESMAEVFRLVANKFFSAVPYRKLFPGL